jgi:hypothetical protein
MFSPPLGRSRAATDHNIPIDSRSTKGLVLPFGWRVAEDHEPDAPVSVRYELRAGSSAEASPRPYRVYAGTDLIAEVCGQLRRQDDARTSVARGGCDVYYSDEFAVLDRAGRVHPFARPLAIRDGSTALTRVPAAELGAETGTTPLPIGLVLVTSYRVGTRWRPRRLTAAPTLLALMGHTVAARGMRVATRYS